MLNEAHASDAQHGMLLRDLLARAPATRAAAPAKAELLTGTEAASSGAVRRIVLMAGSA
jgi:hypothetical protein